jgi:hypothetical protein
MNLFFYDVNLDYIKYLKDAEKAKRGFTRVPDIEYQNEKKMAQNTYDAVITGSDKGLVKASCDFRLLEEAEKKYKQN